VSSSEKDEGKTQANQDDPDVLDRVIGEQPFEIVLHERIQHTEEGGGGTDEQNHQPPLPLDVADEVVGYTHHPIDRRLQHDAAHERGDRRRRRGMGIRTCSKDTGNEICESATGEFVAHPDINAHVSANTVACINSFFITLPALGYALLERISQDRRVSLHRRAGRCSG